ncbi:Rib/alpha-like domain-containing protein [Macrococcoides canis]|uniref:C protein alpha-antigen n=2 Tax=Macrococcoides canis TaxID=1855823 RepID=A0A1W7AEA4_9STAP|nr:Rib/alpha-like domain-containing protein [Macrococcus canis]ARQ07924.1 C protein alpha-antigen precursor [Macrococcus canis]
MNKKSTNKRMDFLPNKLNKYSIRKFTVGTTSILIGSLLFLGTSTDSKAAETTVASTEAATTETPTTEAPTTEAVTTEAPTTEASTTETPTTEAPTTESATTEAPVVVEKATNLNFNADNTQLTGQATGQTVELKLADGTVKTATVQSGTFTFTGLTVNSGDVVEVTVIGSDNTRSEVAQATANVVEAPTTEAPTTEAPTTEGATTEAPTTEAPTTEAPTTEGATTEAPTTESATTEAPTTEAPTTESATTEAPTTEVPVFEPTTESVTATTEKLNTLTTEAEKKAELTNYVVENTGVTEEAALATINSLKLDYSNLTSEELMAALLQGIAANQDANTVDATAATFRTTSLTNNESITLDMNGTVNTLTAAGSTAGDSALIIDGVNVIESGSPTMIQNTVNGKVVEQWTGNPLEINNTTVAKPLEGVRVYAQWVEKSGATSPIFTTTTLADGTYHIVMQDFTGPDGTVYTFDADPNLPQGEKWRVWAETPTGLQLYYSWENSQLGPQSPVMDTSYNAGYGIGNDQLTDFNFIYTAQTDEAVMHDMTNATTSTPVSGEQGYISGTVFWNNNINFGAQTMGSTATNSAGTTDTAATNVTVVGSYLSDYALNKIYSAGQAYMGEPIRGIAWSDADEAKLQDWVKQQIALEGTDLWIAETVTTTTDARGNYTLQFNGTYGKEYNDRGFNGALLDSATNSTKVMPDALAISEGLPIGSTYADLFNRVASSPTQGSWYGDVSASSTNMNIEAAPKHVNLDWTYVSLQGMDAFGVASPYYGNKFAFDTASTSWTNTFKNDTITLQNVINADFALFMDEMNFDVVNYNTSTTPAAPGTTVTTSTVGLPSPEMGDNKYQIVWYDKNGNEVAASPIQAPNTDGTLSSADFLVPATALDGDIYTAKLYSINPTDDVTRSPYPLAIDSFVVVVTDASVNQPDYIDATVKPGTPETIAAPLNADGTPPPSGTTYAPADATTLPSWAVVNANGIITVNPDVTVPAGNVTIPVTVNYPDGSSEVIDVVVTVLPTDAVVNQPEYINATVEPGTTTTIAAPLNPDGTPPPAETTYAPADATSLPSWAVVNPDGTITVNPDANIPEGDYTIPVTVNYPDGSSGVIDVVVTVLPTDAVVNQPEYINATVEPGTTTTIAAPLNSDGTTPPTGTTYAPADATTLPTWAVVNPDGTITVNPGATVTAGDYTIPVTVNYPDGSSEVIDVVVTVLPADKEVNQPEYINATVEPGTTTTIAAPLNSDGTTPPTGTIYASADASTLPTWAVVNPDGTITVNPGVTVTAGDYTIPVTVNYPDGSSEVIDVVVTVLPADKEVNQPEYINATVEPGTTTTIAAPLNSDGTTPPTGTTYAPADATTLPSWAVVNPDGTITVKPGATVTAGDYTIPVTVNYPDGSSEVIDVVVTVGTTDAADNQPEYINTTVEPGTTTTIAAPLDSDGTTLPAGTTYAPADASTLPTWAVVNPDGTITVNPGATVTAADYTIPVTVNYPDGSSEVIDVVVTVGTTDAADNQPEYINTTVEPGTTTTIAAPLNSDGTTPPAGTTYAPADASTLPTWAVVNPDGTITVKPGATVTAGDYTIPVTVNYPDGSSEVIDVVVTVGATDAIDNQPDYIDTTVEPGTPTTIAAPLNSDGTTPPAGTTYAPADAATLPSWVVVNPDGTITVSPDATVTSTQLSVPVTVTYPDGSTEVIDVAITVLEPNVTVPQNLENQPDYLNTTAKPGTTTTIAAPLNSDGTTPPAGTTYAPADATTLPSWVVVNPDGTITATPDTTVASGAYPIKVKVTYPDGTTDVIESVITVGVTDAATYQPNYKDASVEPGDTVTVAAPLNSDGTTPPAGTTYAPADAATLPSWVVVNPDGTITATPDTTVASGAYPIKVTVTYPDGTTDVIESVITVGVTDAATYQPNYKDAFVEPGDTVTVAAPLNSDGTTPPAGTTYAPADAATLPSWVVVNPDGTITATPDTTVASGAYPIKVTVTYPDGTTDVIESVITVGVTDAATYQPNYKDAFVEPGDTVTVAAPLNSDGTTPPAGTTYAPADAATLPSWVVVNPDGTITATPDTTVASGAYPIKVTVTYPDGTTDVIESVITVGVTDAATYQPNYKDAFVEPGDTVTVAAPLNSDGTTPPAGTTYAPADAATLPSWVVVNPDGTITATPDTTVASGAYPIKVTVTYPDGTTDVIESVITVGVTDAATYQPNYKDAFVEPGDTVTVAAPLNSDGTTPPAGTTYAPADAATLPSWVVVNPDGTITATPDTTVASGAYPIKVTVTYPDGTTDVIESVITVGVTDAATYQPNYKDAFVEPGDTVTVAAPLNSDGTTPPAGTTYAPADAATLPSWVVVNPDGTITVNPDVTVPSGQIAVKVTVTYPDGTTDVIESVITVGTTDEVDNQPDYIDATVEPGNTVTVAAPLNSDGTTPPTGTTYAPADAATLPTWVVVNPDGTVTTSPDATVVAGDYNIPVLVTYPDGTTEIINVVITVGTTDAVDNILDYTDVSLLAGETKIISVPLNSNGTSAPAGTTYAPADAATLPSWIVVNPDGTINIAPDTAVLPGSYTIPVLVTFADGSTEEIDVIITVLAPKDITPPVVDIKPIQVGDTTVSGTSEPNAIVTVTLPDGTVVMVNTDATGSWSIPVPPIKEGDKVSAVAKDEAGNVSSPDEEIAPSTVDTTAPVINVDPIQIGDTVVTGTSEPGSTVTVTLSDGTTVTTVTNSDGTWTVNTPVIKSGETVSAVSTDGSGNTSGPDTEVAPVVTADTTAPVINVNPIQIGDTVITGTSEPGSTVTVILPDGTTVTTVTNSDGTWTVDTPVIKSGDTVSAVSTDGSGNTSGPYTEVAPVITADTTAPVINVNPIQIGDTVITGTSEPGSTVTVILPDGTTVTTVTNPDGTWTVDTPVIKSGETVSAVSTDEAGNTSGPDTEVAPVVTADTTAPVINVNPIQIGDTVITGTSEPGSTVTVILPDGTAVTTVTNPDGTWTVDTPVIKSGDTVSAVSTDEAGNTSGPDTEVAPVVTADTTAPVINVNPIQIGDTVVTGTSEPGSTVTVILPDGTTVTTVTNPDGTWTVDTPVIKSGDTVSAVSTDGSGNTSGPDTEVAPVITADTTAPLVDINPVKAGDTVVSGTSEPGSTVTVILPDGTTITTVTNPDGTWSVEVPAIKEGDKFTALATDESGNTSDPANEVAPSSTVVTPPSDTTAPAINLAPIKAGDTVVSGTSESGSIITVILPDGTAVTTVTNPDGTWSVEVPAIKEGETVSAVATDASGNTSKPDTETAPTAAADTTAPAINLAPIKAGDTVVSGTSEPGSIITVILPDGTTVTTVTNPDGTWSVEVPAIKEGETVSAIATDASGNTSKPDTETAPTAAADTTAPAINLAPIKAGDTVVSGTSEPGSIITVILPDGTTVTTVTNPDGTWSVEVPAIKEGETVSAVATDASGNTSKPYTETAPTAAADTTAPAINLAPIKAGDTVVSGTSEPGSIITVILPDGTTVTTVTNPDGTWSVEVPAIKEGETVSAIATDASGNTSKPDTETAPVSPIVTPPADTTAPVIDVNPVKVGDTVVSGTSEPGSTVIVTLPDGTTVTTVTNPDGTWSVEVPAIKEGETVSAVATDASGNTSKPDTETAPVSPIVTPPADTTAPVIDVNPVKPGDTIVSGTSEPGSTVIVTLPDGATVTTVTKPDGTWTVIVPPLKSGETVIAIAKDDAGNVSESSSETVPTEQINEPPVVTPPTVTPPVVDVEPPVIDVDPIKPGDTVVTGTSEPGSTVIVTLPNGEVVKTIVKPDGTWIVTVPPLKEGDTVEAVAIDDAGNTSDVSSETVPVTTKPEQVKPEVKPSNTQATLPDTGEADNGAATAALLAAIGGFALLAARRRRQDDVQTEEK